MHSITQEELIGTCTIEQHGEMVLTGADTSRRIHIYNARVFDFIGSFTAHSSPVSRIFSYGDKIWTLSLVDIRIWNARSPCEFECLYTFHTLVSRPRTITATKSGKILTGSMDGCVLLWDAEKCSVLQEMVVYCNEASYGILSLQEDSKERLWCVTASRVAVWPNSNNLHGNRSDPSRLSFHSRSRSMDTRTSKQLIRGRGRGARGRAGRPCRPARRPRGAPQRPFRPPPALSASAETVPAEERNSTGAPTKAAPVPPPRTKPASDGNIDAFKIASAHKIAQANLAQKVTESKATAQRPDVPRRPETIQRPETPQRPEPKPELLSKPELPSKPEMPQISLVSPRQEEVKNAEISKETETPLKTPNEERKRKKKRIIASFEGMEQKLSSSVSLSKLIGVIPGMELDMIDEGHPVQIICSRVNGKLQLELACPNGLPDMS